MKKIIAFLLLFTVSILLFSCRDLGEQNVTNDIGIFSDTGEIYDTSETFNNTDAINTDDATTDSEVVTALIDYGKYSYSMRLLSLYVVEFGDFIALDDHDIWVEEDEEYEFVGIAVNFVKIFESTILRRDDIVDDLDRDMDLRKKLMALAEHDIADKYDDIILVPTVYADEIKKGDTVMLSLYPNILHCDLVGSATLLTIPIMGTDEDPLWAYPIVDLKLVIPNELQPIGYGQDTSVYFGSIREEFGRSNEYLIELGLDDNLFRDGMTIEELEAYFKLTTDEKNFAPLFEELNKSLGWW